MWFWIRSPKLTAAIPMMTPPPPTLFEASASKYVEPLAVHGALTLGG